jgi:hypothetical protein
MADHERSQRIPKATPEPSLGFTATMTQIMQEQADVIKHMTGKKNIFDISEKIQGYSNSWLWKFIFSRVRILANILLRLWSLMSLGARDDHRRQP